MKGLLYKKFASSKAMLLFSAAIFLVSSVLKFFQEDMPLPFSVDIYMVYAVIIIARNIGESDKTSWDSYARALPCKGYQRIGARYLFSLILFVAVFAAFALLSAVTRLWGQSVNFGEKLLSWAENELPVYLIYLILFAFTTAFTLPVSYAMKKSGLKALIMGVMYVPSFFTLIYLVLIDALGGYNGLTEAVMKIEVLGLFAAVTAVTLAASFCFSVIFETKSEKEKLRPVKISAAVLTAAAIVLLGIAVGALYKDGALTKNAYSIWDIETEFDKWTEQTSTVPSFSYNYDEISKEEKERNDAFARPIMTEILDKICGKTLIDQKTADIYSMFDEMGYSDYFSENQTQPAGERLINILTTTGKYSETPEYSDIIIINANVVPAVIVYPDSYETYDDADKKHAEIMELFHVGTEESDAVGHMKELGICPYEVSESLKSGVPMRTYRFKIEYYSEYKQAKKPAVSVEFDVINGRISDVR